MFYKRMLHVATSKNRLILSSLFCFFKYFSLRKKFQAKLYMYAKTIFFCFTGLRRLQIISEVKSEAKNGQLRLYVYIVVPGPTGMF